MIKILVLSMGFIFLTPWSVAQQNQNLKFNTGWFSDIAIKGYDTVAYHIEEKAKKGREEFSYKYGDATWLFESQKNLDLFKSEPQKYVPQYGGYCAYAVAKDDTAGIDPEIFEIVDGKLYLNYNAEIGKKWSAKKADYIQQGDKNWPHLSH